MWYLNVLRVPTFDVIHFDWKTYSFWSAEEGNTYFRSNPTEHTANMNKPSLQRHAYIWTGERINFVEEVTSGEKTGHLEIFIHCNVEIVRIMISSLLLLLL